MVIFNHSKMPMPQRYRCRFESDFNCLINNATYLPAGTQIATISMNGLYQPWNTSVGLNWGTAPYSIISYGVTTNPQGLSNLMNTTTAGTTGMYGQYRVYASKIIVSVFPNNIGDNVQFCVCPVTGTNLPTSYFTMRADRFAVEGQSSVYGITSGRGRNTVKKYLTIAEMFGTSKSAIMDDLSTEFSATGNTRPGFQSYWCFCMNTTDNATLQQAVAVRIRVIWYAELFAYQGTREVTS